MGFPAAGGTADKLGNRYEGRWVVKQLLRLLNEQVCSVELEAMGDEAAGVDLRVVRNDGVLEAHQCKAFNRSKGNWSIADLNSREVLPKAVEHLATNANREFWFVSRISASELEDLSRNARDGDGNPESFFHHWVKDKPRQKHFADFCRRLKLDPDDTSGRATAFDLLKRILVPSFADDFAAREDLRSLASFLIIGMPDLTIAVLAEIAQDNIHKALTAPDLRQLLNNYGLQPVPRDFNPLIAERLETLRDDFVESIKPLLPEGRLILRSETAEVLRILDSDNSPDGIVLHGDAGFGKSGVLYQLESELRQRGTTVLAVRLDRKRPQGTTHEYGARLGLPSSPVGCLRNITAGRPAVLILDQLDALRWTSAHAEEGLDVCKGLVREIEVARSLGANIHVVLACRTFDLQRDKEIHGWLDSNRPGLKLTKVEVKALPLETVREFIQSRKIAPDSLSPRRLALLESVQRLAMWAAIVKTEHSAPDFDNSTQLLRIFWKNRRQMLEHAGCVPKERDEVIQRLVEHMESNACLDAPARLLGTNERLQTELQTWGVISNRDGRVSFGHQSNLDYLIAEGVLTRMAIEHKTVSEWLGGIEQQSLFRREQLRQVLFLLADEDHAKFLETVTSMLELPNVRFHMRQLTLEALGQVTPRTETLDLVVFLLGDQRWSEHVRIHIVTGSPMYVSGLEARGLLFQWLTSTDAETWRRAANWMWSVRQTLPVLVAQVCRRLTEAIPDWSSRVFQIVGHDGEDTEIDELFALRLECLRCSSEQIYVSWEKFAKTHPRRAIQLYQALVVGWLGHGAKKSDRSDSTSIFARREGDSLVKAAQQCPKLAWRLYWPLLLSMLDENRKRRREWQKGSRRKRYMPREERVPIPITLHDAVRSAAKTLSRRHPKWLIEFAKSPEASRSRSLQSLVADAMASLPIRYADQAIQWILDDVRRLHCGAGRKRHRWSPAAKLIRKMSPHCSAKLFLQLEHVLSHYHDPDEKRLAKYWLDDVRRGYFRSHFGQGPFHLLPALCPNRRSRETTSRIGVLNYKFADYPRGAFLSGSVGRGGVVMSPIDEGDRYARMSDKAWLRLITDRSLPTIDGPMRNPRSRRGGFIESTVEMMSRSLGRAASCDPERFGRLALKIPSNAPPTYLAEILGALAKTTPQNEVPEAKRATWMPATAETVLRVLEHAPLTDHDYQTRSFCWAVRDRDDLVLTQPILSRLMRYAEHPDPMPDELSVSCNERASECSLDTLETNAINCVRSLAAMAIGSTLWQQKELLAELQPTIESLIDDGHAAVQIAATSICLPVWNINRELAVDWLVRAVRGDLRVAACRSARHFYNLAFNNFADRLVPVIQEMIQSPIAEVAEVGAGQATARWLFQGLFESDVRECLNGSVPQRKGVADTVAQFVVDAEYTERCLPLVLRFLDDEDKEVRNELLRLPYHDEFFGQEWAPGFLTDYVRSKSFLDDSSRILWKLKESHGSVERFAEAIIAVADVFKTSAKEQIAASGRYFDFDSLLGLLLRLYERSTGPNRDSIRQRCLDTWDNLFESQASLAWSLTRGLDREEF